MNPSDESSWAATRAEGRRRYIIRRGVLGWAIPTGVMVSLTLFVIVPVFLTPDSPNFGYLRSRAFALSLLASVLLWPVGGWLFGMIEWRRNERRFGERNPA